VIRTLLVVVVVALVPVATPAAEDQCGLFSKNEACRQGSPQFRVTLTPDQTLIVKPGTPDATRGIVARFTHPRADQPIDCDMVRWVDSSRDPLIAKRPPADVHHTMRVVEVPACSKPEPGRAPIR